MTYDVSLSLASLATGSVLAASSLPGVIAPAATKKFLLSLPRNYTAGVILMIASLAWSVWLLTSVLDLGEFTPQRGNMIIFVVALAAATIFFLPDYLFSRAWGVFLLLCTEILLSACFPHDTRWKLLLVIMAYGWATSGLIFVSAPFTLRNLLERWNSTETMTRISSAVNLLIGTTLVILAFTVYSGK